MADLPHTICFRTSTQTWEELRTLAREDNRKLGDKVRMVVEWALAEMRQRGKHVGHND